MEPGPLFEEIRYISTLCLFAKFFTNTYITRQKECNRHTTAALISAAYRALRSSLHVRALPESARSCKAPQSKAPPRLLKS